MSGSAEPAVLIENEWEQDEGPSPNVLRKISEKQRRQLLGRPKYAFRNIQRILARLRKAQNVAFLLDCDGTLVPLKRHPADVRVPDQVKKVLGRLTANPRLFVATVSGRKIRELKALLNVAGLHYVGLHGAESEWGSTQVAPATVVALHAAKRTVRQALQAYPGIWVEDKGLTFAVHYRRAKPAVRNAASVALARLLEPWGDAFHVLDGSRVWEVLPKEVVGKSSAVLRILKHLPPGTPAIHIGDDGTDELAFRVLEDQITVRVGNDRPTRARYYVHSPSEVVRFLARLERELRN